MRRWFSDLPAAMCVRAREVVVYASHSERDARWPALKGLSSTGEAVARGCDPKTGQHRRIPPGPVVLSTRAGREGTSDRSSQDRRRRWRGRPAVAKQTFAISADRLVSRCFRTGRTQIADPLPPALAPGVAVGPETAPTVVQAGIRSALAAPIAWAGQTMGVLSLAFVDSGPARSAWVRETAEGLTLRAGVALHNASLYDAERTSPIPLSTPFSPPACR